MQPRYMILCASFCVIFNRFNEYVYYSNYLVDIGVVMVYNEMVLQYFNKNGGGIFQFSMHYFAYLFNGN